MVSSHTNGDKSGYHSDDGFGDVEIGNRENGIPQCNGEKEHFLSTPGRETHQRKHVVASDNGVHSKPDPSPARASSKSRGRRDTSTHNASKRGQVLFACFLQTFCSCAMVLVNKQLASSYNHLIEGDLNILLVVFQALVAVVSVEICKAMTWVDYPTFDYRTAKLWAPVNLLFCGMLFTGMASLQHNTVPMVTVFKNIANIFISAG